MILSTYDDYMVYGAVSYLNSPHIDAQYYSQHILAHILKNIPISLVWDDCSKPSLKRSTQTAQNCFGNLRFSHVKYENIYTWEYLVPIYHFK